MAVFKVERVIIKCDECKGQMDIPVKSRQVAISRARDVGWDISRENCYGDLRPALCPRCKELKGK